MNPRRSGACLDDSPVPAPDRRCTNTHLGAAVLSALVEPFTFIPLLHTGALLGWWQFLTGRQTWVPQRRNGIRSERG
jgi:hypothetical protein